MRPWGLWQWQPHAELVVVAVGFEAGGAVGYPPYPWDVQQGPGRYLCARSAACPQETGTCLHAHVGLRG